MKCINAYLLCVCLIGSVASGCGKRTAGSIASGEILRDPVTDHDVRADQSIITITDRLGRSVRFTTPPQRIVSLTPSVTEILFAIDAGERIVGATKFCDYPAAARDIPRIGGGTLESINQEKILELEPDLVLCKWDSHEPLLRNLERLEIPALAVGPESLAELYEETRALGRIVESVEQAEAMIESMQARIAMATARVPSGERPRVFYQVWDQPLMTAGRGSYITELLGLAGAENLFTESRVSYPKVSAEAVVAADPDVIIAPASHAAPVTVESILNRQGWSGVRAVRGRRVYIIDRDTISRCGPRLVDALEEIVGVLYGEPVLEVSGSEL